MSRLLTILLELKETQESLDLRLSFLFWDEFGPDVVIGPGLSETSPLVRRRV